MGLAPQLVIDETKRSAAMEAGVREAEALICPELAAREIPWICPGCDRPWFFTQKYCTEARGCYHGRRALERIKGFRMLRVRAIPIY